MRYALHHADGRYRARFDPTHEGDVEALLEQYQQRAERDREALEHMIDYAQTGQCRWRTILAHFGEGWFDRCGTCGTCLHPPHVEPLPESASPQGRMLATKRKTLDARLGFARGAAREKIFVTMKNKDFLTIRNTPLLPLIELSRVLYRLHEH